MKPIRLLTAREIECRVAQITRTGSAISLLLYKDARCDMAILDETFGPLNWQRRHSRDNANCIVSLWDEDKRQWVEKEDTGTESNTEAEKGLASDSFKRACVNVGIGRELYTAPQIWIKPPNCEIKNEGGKFKCYDRFEVSEIGYNDHREINRLVIINSKTHNPVFTFGTASEPRKGPSRPTSTQPKERVAEPPKTADRPQGGAVPLTSRQMATEDQKQIIVKTASDEDYMAIMQKYGANLENLTANQASAVIRKLEEKADKPDDVGLVLCERCGTPVTGVVMPDGKLMSAAEIVGKSKLKYNGVYCFNCAKELNNASKARKAG